MSALSLIGEYSSDTEEETFSPKKVNLDRLVIFNFVFFETNFLICDY